MWHNKISLKTERIDRRPEQAEVKIKTFIQPRPIFEDAAPDDRGDLIMDALLDREPVVDVSYVLGDMVKTMATMNHTRNHPGNTQKNCNWTCGSP